MALCLAGGCNASERAAQAPGTDGSAASASSSAGHEPVTLTVYIDDATCIDETLDEPLSHALKWFETQYPWITLQYEAPPPGFNDAPA